MLFEETKTEWRVIVGWAEGKLCDEQKLPENCSGNLYISPLAASSREQYLANKFCISQKLTAFLITLLQVFKGEKRSLGIFGTYLAILIRQNLMTGRGLCVHHWCNHCYKYNDKSLCLWWCHTWQCWAAWLWNIESMNLHSFWEIIPLFYSNWLPFYCSSAEKLHRWDVPWDCWSCLGKWLQILESPHGPGDTGLLQSHTAGSYF